METHKRRAVSDTLYYPLSKKGNRKGELILKRSGLYVWSLCAYGAGLAAYAVQQHVAYPLLGGWISGVLLMLAFRKEELKGT